MKKYFYTDKQMFIEKLEANARKVERKKQLLNVLDIILIFLSGFGFIVMVYLVLNVQ